MDWFARVKAFLWENKEGAVIGAVAGYFIIAPLLAKDASAVSSLQAAGVVDLLKSSSANVTDFARTKAVWFGTAVGALLGTLVDALLPEGFLNRWFK